MPSVRRCPNPLLVYMQFDAPAAVQLVPPAASAAAANDADADAAEERDADADAPEERFVEQKEISASAGVNL